MDQTTSIDQPRIEAPESSGTASIVQILGDQLGRRYAVDGELTLGRAHTNHVVLHVENVSRHHAIIYQQGETTLLADRGSTNGTLVNDAKVQGDQELEHGDLIRIGNVIFRFISGDDAEAHFHEEIYRLAITDGLTGQRNRRYFDDFLEREVARSLRSGAELSLLLFDLDDFKRINDSYGHLFGDRVLREIADIVDGMTRREQLLGRFGGDEFAIVLPDVPLEGALAFGERIRQAIGEHRFGSGERSTKLSLSVGAATLVGDMNDTDLVERADRSLYEAKKAGRNQVYAVQAISTKS